MIQRCAQFWFFRRRSGNSFSTTLCVWFFKKKVSCYLNFNINWPNSIVWLLLLLEILGNMLPLLLEILGNICIYFPGCDVINFEINLIFLIKLNPFFWMIKKLKTHSQVWDNFDKWKLFKNDEKKAFYFTSKAFFVPDFLPCIKTAWLKR